MTDQIIVVPARIAGLIIGFLVLRWVLHKVIRKFARRTGNGAVAGVLSKSKIGQGFVENTLANERRTQRAETIASLLCSTVTIVLTAVLVVMVLAELGFNVVPVVASASIIGVVLGFGAQTLVKDFLAGVFMIFEDQYGVGDLIDMEKATGVGGGGRPADHDAPRRGRHHLVRPQRRGRPGRQPDHPRPGQQRAPPASAAPPRRTRRSRTTKVRRPESRTKPKLEIEPLGVRPLHHLQREPPARRDPPGLREQR